MILLGDGVHNAVDGMIIAAGNFVYTAGTDLVPEFKDEPDSALALRRSITFLAGLAVLYVLAP